MWGFFRPRCPLETYEKTWTETRMTWLAQQLGLERLRKAAVIVPGTEHFPEDYRGTDADVERIFDQLCDWMEVDPTRVQLEITDDQILHGAVGLYERHDPAKRATIRVVRSQLADPLALVATLSHELSHEILLGGNLLDQSVSDHEWITDLLMVYLGVGVFAANTSVRDATERVGNTSWWSIRKQGYLPSRMLGYGMALFAFARGERKPAWAQHLSRDARSALTDGLRFVEKTGESLFRPDEIGGAVRRPEESEIRERLQSRNASARLAALWNISDDHFRSASLLEAVANCLQDRDPAVGSEAVRTLGRAGEAAHRYSAQIRQELSAEHSDLRSAASFALGSLKTEAATTVSELCLLLKDPVRKVRCTAAWALGQYGAPIDSSSARQLMKLLEGEIVNGEYPTADMLGAVAASTIPDLDEVLRAGVAGRDMEMRRLVLEAIKSGKDDGVAEESSVRKKKKGRR